jgi:pimeloyl-ACP methyl ester carboxylesterase
VTPQALIQRAKAWAGGGFLHERRLRHPSSLFAAITRALLATSVVITSGLSPGLAFADLPANTVFTNFNLLQPDIWFETGNIIDYPGRLTTDKRKVTYRVPLEFAIGAPATYPLIIALHGGGQSGLQFVQDFSSTFDRGVALVLPWADNSPNTGYGGHFLGVGAGQTAGSASCVPDAVTHNVVDPECFQDLRFLAYLIDGVLTTHPQLNPDQVYVMGHSNGAGLAWNMLCYASTFRVNGVQRRIAGFAMHGKALGGHKQRAFCTSGGTPAGFFDPAGMNQAAQPYGLGIAGGQVVPVFFAGGTADSHIYVQPGGAGPDDPMINTGGLDDAEATIAWLLGKHRLSPVATYVNMNYMNTVDESVTPPITSPVNITTVRQRYITPNPLNPPPLPPAGVMWYRIDGGGHPPPDTEWEAGDANSCRDYDWTERSLDFFIRAAGLVEGPY